ncbi:MAG: MmgE/PrpD family protein [Candidatus Dormibacteraeota bacterium]|uniref:MmgE/PrpD family protein n=2 Tax=Candidatus Dormibacteria TaxID=3126996 RepID=A0A934N5H6_9BACT|nr:MmgE/PrpD family protein [Candidatus Dormibacteraeota bacterium]MBJ7603964.1 MmgE/PrpD family protein [Candidatus Dormibacteraeota bacterium]
MNAGDPDRKFCEWAVDFRWSDVDPALQQHALRLVADHLGCVLGGVDHSTAAACRRLSPWVEGGATIIGTPLRSTASEAARQNSIASHVIEMDDLVPTASLHPGSVVIPAALAAAEHSGADGKQTLAAIVAGYELIIRLGEAVDPARHYADGFHPTATCGIFAAACAAALLRGADAPTLRRALGFAATGASGTLSYLNDGAPTKPVQVGNAAAYGVMAAILNDTGVPGPSTVFSGRHGFYQAYAPQADPERLVDGLGCEPLRIGQTGFKPLACCGYIQPAAGLVLELVRGGLRREQVDRIRVGVVSTGMPIIGEPRAAKLHPASVTDAQFSLPFCVAVVLSRGRLTPVDLVADLRDPEVAKLAERVDLVPDVHLDADYPQHWGGWVELELHGGHRLRREAGDAKGYPGNPLSRAELEQKVATMAGQERGEAIMEAAEILPDGGVRALLAHLEPTKVRSR